MLKLNSLIQMRYRLFCAILVLGLCPVLSMAQEQTSGNILPHKENFNRENLHAWAFVFADPVDRTPEDRAKVLAGLGFKKTGFGALQQHVMKFEEYVIAYQKNGIELIGVYRAINTEVALEDPGTSYLFEIIEKHGIKPQVWLMMNDKLLKDLSREKKADKALEILKPVVLKARSLSCQVALYNHTSWFGEPENQIEMVRRLRSELKDENIGIVYNFHHGHSHNARFEEFFPQLESYLYSLHLNGMTVGGNKIMTIGTGEREKEMIEAVYKTGYSGPVGILDHDSKRKPEEVYPENFAGLNKLLEEIGDSKAAASY